jgi:hypothetical protein
MCDGLAPLDVRRTLGFLRCPMKRASLDGLSGGQCLADVGRKVSVGRLEFVPPRGGVDALTPGEVGGKIFDVDLHPGPVGGELV